MTALICVVCGEDTEDFTAHSGAVVCVECASDSLPAKGSSEATP